MSSRTNEPNGPEESRDPLESGIRDVHAEPEYAMIIAYYRHPGRWTRETFAIAARIPGVFESLTTAEAEEVLDRVQAIAASVRPCDSRDVATGPPPSRRPH